MPDNQLTLNEKKIYPYLDIIKILACFFVIVNHSNPFVDNLFYPIFIESPVQSFSWIASMFISLISKTAVPMFIMITGYLSLGQKTNYSKTFTKIFKTIGILATINIVAFFVKNLYTSNDVLFALTGIKASLFDWFFKPTTNALWYMYLYLAILVMMPLLQKFCIKMEKKDYLYMFLISFCFLGSLDIITYFTSLDKPFYEFNLIIFSAPIGFLFIGYYINKFVTLNNKIFIFSLIGFVVCTIFTTALFYFHFLSQRQEPKMFFDNIYSINFIIPSICLFIIIKYISSHIHFSDKKVKLLRELGKCTFPAYLLGDFVLRGLDEILLTEMVDKMGEVISRLLFSVIVFVISMISAWILRRFPIIKKFI